MAVLTDLTIAQLTTALARKEASAVDVADAHLKKLDEHRALNAFITETPDKAREMAKASDARRAKGEAGLLDGVPLAIKDLFCTEGVQTTAGSHILEGFVPPYESTVTANLWKAGAVMVGKTNLDEFAMGSSNMTSHFGGVENPWKRKGDNRKLVPGGSSGGSAAAVAAYMVPGSTGTDTGGSIRQPASFCGIVGLKPTYGRCSRWGVVAFASSLDQPGPLARTVEDSALLLQAHGWPRSEGFRPRRRCRCRTSRPPRATPTSRGCGSAFPRNIASTARRPRSWRCGPRAWRC